MPELPNPIHIALLGAVFAVITILLTLGQRLGDWRSKRICQGSGRNGYTVFALLDLSSLFVGVQG